MSVLESSSRDDVKSGQGKKSGVYLILCPENLWHFNVDCNKRPDVVLVNTGQVTKQEILWHSTFDGINFIDF